MYRLVVLLLALSAVTMSFVFVTIGKYSTNNGTQDSARVAAFGVRIKASDTSSFETEYSTDGKTITVKSSSGDKIVAPGTADKNGIKFSVTGKPEVATELLISVTPKNDVFLKTEKNGAEYVYKPVRFALVCGGELLASGTLAELSEKLETIAITFDAGETLDREISLSWEWSYDSVDENGDVYDTALGDIAANIVPEGMEEGADYSLDVEYEISITVNQID